MPDNHRPRFTRRRMLKTLAAGAAASFGAVGWTLGVEPHWVETQHRYLSLVKLPKALSGKRLVQISDLHIGETDLDYLISTCAGIASLKPDLIAFTGDYLDRDFPAAMNNLGRVMAALPRAPLGSFGCLGNHDYRGHASWRNLSLADRISETLTSLGVRVLRDEVADVAGLQIVGLDDLWSPRFNGEHALASVDAGRDAICLSHNPDSCDLDVWGKFRGAILSGHTHGGQCKPPFLPPPVLPVRNRRYVAGWYEITPTRRVYVNRGLGHTLRARFNCRPEITVFTLVAI